MKLHCAAPADAREETYRLLASRSPAKVVIDVDLPDGVWYVVRGRTPTEACEDAAREAMWEEFKRNAAREKGL